MERPQGTKDRKKWDETPKEHLPNGKPPDGGSGSLERGILPISARIFVSSEFLNDVDRDKLAKKQIAQQHGLVPGPGVPTQAQVAAVGFLLCKLLIIGTTTCLK